MVLCALVWGCGEDSPSADAGTQDGGMQDGGADAKADAEPSDPDSGVSIGVASASLKMASHSACDLDADCEVGSFCFQGACTIECEGGGDCFEGETCDARGRCLDSDGETVGLSTLYGMHVVKAPASRVAFRGEELKTRATITLDQEVPTTGMWYRVSSENDPEGSAAKLYRALRSSDDPQTAVLELPPQVLGSDGTVDLEIVSAVGSFRVQVAGPTGLSGSFAGTLELDGFGSQGVPFAFEVTSEDASGALVAGKAAWLTLRVEAADLFSPTHGSEPAGTLMTRPLEYDAFSRAWVARFASEWSFDADSLFPWMAQRYATRAMRIELTPSDEGFVGTLKDAWSGLYEKQNEVGAVAPETAVLSGDFEVIRIADGNVESPSAAALVDEADELLPLPPLDACIDGMLNGVCASEVSLADFEAADDDLAADCALAVADVALADQTVAAQVETYISGGSVGARSFAQFLDACASNEEGLCLPSPEVLCARQLTAHALKRQPPGALVAADLIAAFQDSTREAQLGAQFGAFHADAHTRLSWLQSTDFPALVTAQVQSHMRQLLDSWRANVLDVHMDVLRGYLDESGAVALSMEASGDALTARKRLLTEVTQAWRAAMDALTLATVRWGTLLLDDYDRAEKAEYVAARLRDLYIAAALITELNRSAGNGALNATLAAGFGALRAELRLLEQPFSSLQFDREAEVTVSKSLNPSDSNDTLLTRLRSAAEDSLDAADVSVGGVINSAQEKALDEELLRAELNQSVVSVRDELIELCGQPSGCTPEQFSSVDGSCAVGAKAGQCGFELDPSAGKGITVSAAGSAVLEVVQAAAEVSRAREDYAGRLHDAQLYQVQTQAFEENVLRWNEDRESLNSQLRKYAEALVDSRDAAVADIGRLMEEQASVRDEAFAAQTAGIAEWGSRGDDAIFAYFDVLEKARGIDLDAAVFSASADLAAELAEVGGDAARNPESFATGIAQFATLVEIVAIGVQSGAAYNEAFENEYADSLREAAEQTRELEDGVIHSLELEGQLELDKALSFADELSSQIELVQASSDAEAAALEGAMAALERDVLTSEQFERDLFELDERHREMLARARQTSSERQRVLQAEGTLQQKQIAYGRLVQTAQLLMGRYEDILSHRDRVSQIVGSPAAVFAWSNRLVGAERELERVKSDMMDWLVALEYAAVRPFFDQRLRLLLARNATQLAAIFDELDDLQDSCGGPVNQQTVELSVLRDLLSITTDQVDGATQTTQTPGQRLRALLAEGAISVDKRARLSTDSSVGALVDRGDVWALSFVLDIESFANLKLSCNARLSGVAMKVVGEGLGKKLPVVNLLYDGSSQLRSCQPDIRELVDLVGPDITVFDEITPFRVATRSVAPVAGINEFPGDMNTTLDGLPLVSEYTLLIDRTAGDNDELDWDAVEDVELKLTYTYQDVFAEDHSCGN